MKKSFLLLPLAAFLAACQSNGPAPVVNADGSGAAYPSNNPNGGWQTEVEAAPMPSNMNTLPAAQPVYQPPVQPQPVYTPPSKPAAPVAKKSVPQNFVIPRDEKNLPIYSQIDKGFYNGDSYTVRKGDTMFLIAYIAGKDVSEIAALNNMSEPYQLRVGQTLKLGNSANQSVSAPAAPAPKPVEPEVTYTNAPNGTAYGSDGTVTGPVKAGTGTAPAPVRPTVVATAGTAPAVKATTSNEPAPVASSIKWQWPTQGRVISGFSSAEGGNKGLDIAGTKGQPVKAAAAGKVVYAGNALQGYGNLIIIKHNDDFLSAYAHNDSIKVEEQDNVKAGQTIATLGSTGTNSNKLHFEIRYHGKSVDPARYLPRQ